MLTVIQHLSTRCAHPHHDIQGLTPHHETLTLHQDHQGLTPRHEAPTSHKHGRTIIAVALQKEAVGVIKKIKPGFLCQSSLMSQFSKHSKANIVLTNKRGRADVPASDYVTANRQLQVEIEIKRQDTSRTGDIITTPLAAAGSTHQMLGFPCFSPPAAAPMGDINSTSANCATVVVVGDRTGDVFPTTVRRAAATVTYNPMVPALPWLSLEIAATSNACSFLLQQGLSHWPQEAEQSSWLR